MKELSFEKMGEIQGGRFWGPVDSSCVNAKDYYGNTISIICTHYYVFWIDFGGCERKDGNWCMN